jgi:GntR family transcriptional regulator, galactonate operon transcriptional repressor
MSTRAQPGEIETMAPKRPSRSAPGTLSTQVMHLLGQRIVAGDFRVGESMPVEATLCRRFAVSRTTLREAMKKLHGKGLIAIAPKSGTRVRPASDWNQLDPDVLAWRLQGAPDRDLLRQLYEMRQAIEPEACRLAATNADEGAREAIARAYDGLATARHDPARVVDADVAFHMAIVEATRNVFLTSLAAAIRATLGFSFALGVPGKPFSTSELRRHRLIMEQILARRGDAAALTMRSLLQESHRTLAAALGLPRTPVRKSTSRPGGSPRA